MKHILKLTLRGGAFLIVCGVAFSQEPAKAKAITRIDPIFPAEAANPLYGDEVSVVLTINKKGNVFNTEAVGPLAPCGALDDPMVAKIGKIAEEAAKKTVFEPILQDGKPVEASVRIKYRLTPPKPVPSEGELPSDAKKNLVGSVVNGKVIYRAAPNYSARARANRTGGSVSVSVLISEDGSILSAAPVSGHPDLIRESLIAACKSKYSPTTLAGQPVRVMGILTYNYNP